MPAPAINVSEEELARLENILLGKPDASKGDAPVPLKARFRALFTLKALKHDTRAIDIIGKGDWNEELS
jgi:hypothetical protein